MCIQRGPTVSSRLLPSEVLGNHDSCRTKMRTSKRKSVKDLLVSSLWGLTSLVSLFFCGIFAFGSMLYQLYSNLYKI